MSDDNGEFELLTVDGGGNFRLGEKKLAWITLGEIGAVFKIRRSLDLPDETLLLRVLRVSTVELDKSSRHEMLACGPICEAMATSITMANAYREMGYKWYLRLNADLTQQHMESNETIREAEARIYRLTDIRNTLIIEKRAVDEEDDMLREKFTDTIRTLISGREQGL